MTQNNNLLTIGQITNTHGLKGDITIYPYIDDPDKFKNQSFYIEGLEGKFEFSGLQIHKNLLLAKIKGYNTIEEVIPLKGKNLYIDKTVFQNLEKDEFFIVDLVGLRVYLENGEPTGEIKEVLSYAANDIYVIQKGEKEYMIPAVKEFIKEINVKDGFVVIAPIKGMMPE